MTRIKNYVCFTLIFLLSLSASACLPKTGSSALEFEILKPEFSSQGDIIFAFLQLESAILNEDKEKMSEAVDVLLELDPENVPLLDIGAWFFMFEERAKAREILTKYISLKPDDFNGRLLLAEILVEEDESALAIQVLKDYINTHTENTNALADFAIFYLRINQIEQANQIFATLSENQKTPIIRFYHAQALHALNQTSEAIFQLEEALKTEPDFYEALSELALLHEEQLNYNEAIKYYQKIYAFDQTNLEIQNKLIRLYFLSDNAKEGFKFAKDFPDNSYLLLSLASTFIDENRYDLAQIIADYVAKNDPLVEDVNFYYAAIAFDVQKDINLALSYIDRIPKESPNYLRALSIKVELLLIENQFENALTLVEEGLKLAPTDNGLFSLALQLYYTLDKIDIAYTVLGPIVQNLQENSGQIGPNEAELIYSYSVLLLEDSKEDKAIPILKNTLLVDPFHIEAMNTLAYIYADKNINLKEALKLINQALENDWEKGYMLDTLAWVQYRLKDYKNAWENIRKAISLEQERGIIDPTILEHYGYIALKLGYKKEAKEAFTKAIELKSPNQIELEKELGKIK